MTTADQVQLDQQEDNGQLSNYRPLSGLAVIAVVLGLASALAILSPALWILPLVGLVASVIALRRIALSDPPMVGRKAALAGLLLSVFWGVSGATTHLSQRWITRSQAQQVAHAWFQYMLQGHTPRAHQLTIDPERRELRLDELDTIYATTPHLVERLESFMNEPGPTVVLRFDAKADVRYVQTENQFRSRDNDYVLMQFELQQPGTSGQTQQVVVEMRRKPGESGGWIVQEIIPYSTYLRVMEKKSPGR